MGRFDGARVVGETVGTDDVGEMVGSLLGLELTGLPLGAVVGANEGDDVVGETVGSLLGLAVVGATVGIPVLNGTVGRGVGDDETRESDG